MQFGCIALAMFRDGFLFATIGDPWGLEVSGRSGAPLLVLLNTKYVIEILLVF